MRYAAFLSTAIALAQIASINIASAQTDTESSASVIESDAPMTLAMAMRLALANNPDIAIVKREYEATEGAVLQGQARPNPELAIAQEDVRQATRSTSAQLSWPIEIGGKRAARITSSERGRDVALSDVAVRQSEIRAAVIAAYFEVLTQQERVRLAQETTALASRATDAASKRVVAGKISPIEESKAKVAELGSKLELSQAQGELRATRQKLSLLWGNPVPRFERVQASEKTEVTNLSPELLEQRLSQSTYVKRAKFELQRRQALSQLERTKRIPDPTVNFGVKRSADVGNQVLLGITIALPVFDRNQGNLLESLKREDKARDELSAVKLRLRGEVLMAFERLAIQRSEVDVLSRDVLPSVQAIYAAALKGFDAGKFSFLEVLDAQRSLIQTQAQYLRAVAETYRVSSDIDRLIGDQQALQLN